MWNAESLSREQIPDNFVAADLRSREIGKGFDWEVDAEIRRCGSELFYGIERKVQSGSVLRRLLGRC
jgi:hypothetical protein